MGADPTALTDVAATWFVRMQRDDISAVDRRDFELWLDADPRHAVEYARIEATWERAERLTSQAVEPALGARRSKWGAPISRRAAAGMFLAAGAAGAGLFVARRGQTFRTAVGERRRVRLADGSGVILNTASELSVRYSRRLREVRLVAGEALFEVAPDPSRPFLVSAGGVVVRALGTAFNVRRRGALAEVTVTEGVVTIGGSRELSLARLRAGQAAVAGTDAVSELILDTDALQARTAWRRGLIELRGETLEAAVAEFNRYSAHKLAVADPSIAGIRVGGAFGTNEADKFVTALELGFPVATRRDADGVTRLVRRE